MASAPGDYVGDKYVLPTGNEDARRLDVIHAVFGAVSEKGLERASVSNAARAVDIASEQIEVAKGIGTEDGASPIHYLVGSAYEPGLPEYAYDVVFCRLVLCHLSDPQKAVARIARLLRPGGRLVLVDMDLRDTFTMPRCAFLPVPAGALGFPRVPRPNVCCSSQYAARPQHGGAFRRPARDRRAFAADSACRHADRAPEAGMAQLAAEVSEFGTASPRRAEPSLQMAALRTRCRTTTVGRVRLARPSRRPDRELHSRLA